MRLGADADGALLQHALDGQLVDDDGIAVLVAVARRVEALDQRGLAPRAAFVAELRQRLTDEPAESGITSDPGPAVVRFGRRARLLLAAAASLFVLVGGLGAVSRSAVPGDRLYPVKQVLDRVALELHRDPVGLGRAHLDQAREHVAEAEQLVARLGLADGAETAPAAEAERSADRRVEDAIDLASALDAATGSSVTGERLLREAFRSGQRGDALTSLSDFYAEVLPTVDALDTPPLPPVAAAAWQRLHDVLTRGQDATLRELAACNACGEASAAARSLLGRSLAPPAGTGNAAGAPATRATSATPATSLIPATPATPVGDLAPESSARPGGGTTTRTDPPSAEAPSGPRPTSGEESATGGGRSGGSSPGTATRLPSVTPKTTRPSAGGIVTLPGRPPTVGLPGGGVVTLPAPPPTVRLPEVAGSTGVTLGGGGITLPGATVSPPTVVVPLP